MIMEQMEVKEKCEALTVDSIPEIYGSNDLFEYFILHADLTSDAARSILYTLYIVATQETYIRATVTTANLAISEAMDQPRTPDDAIEMEIKETCAGAMEKMKLMIRGQEKKKFSVIDGGV